MERSKNQRSRPNFGLSFGVSPIKHVMDQEIRVLAAPHMTLEEAEAILKAYGERYVAFTKQVVPRAGRKWKPLEGTDDTR